jgi:hypothetical protein
LYRPYVPGVEDADWWRLAQTLAGAETETL